MKKISTIFLLIFGVFAYCANTFSFSGWNKVDGEFVYLNSDGNKLQNSWIIQDEATFYLDDNGHILKNTLFEYDDDLYYLDPVGRRICKQFIYIDLSVNAPYGTREGIYYFDERGRAVKKTNSSNFKRSIDGEYYAFDEDGVFCEGWFDREGERLTDPSTYLTEGMYYTDENGKLYHNRWYKFTDDLGSAYFSDEESLSAGNSYNDMDSLWMYFDNTCKKVASSDNGTKIKDINGNKYAFDNNGIMIEGFVKNGDLSYSQPSNPSLTSTIKLFSFTTGEGYKNKWLKAVPSKFMSSEDFNDDNPSWYYVNGSNNIVYNKCMTIDGNKYAFDGIGRMKTGFCLIDGNGLFVSNFKPDELTRDDFVYSITEGSHLYGSELNNLRYFELGEDNGKMLTGNVKIELIDGTYNFLFNSSGIAEGNKHELKKHSDVYYINGLKLEPMEDMKYGIVKVSDNEYVVVNKNGKIIKGNKKLIKDDYENTMVILNNKLAGYLTDVHDKIKLKWVKTSVPGISNLSGYYYYNNESNVKAYTKLAVALGTTCPTADEISNIPTEMRLNFR